MRSVLCGAGALLVVVLIVAFWSPSADRTKKGRDPSPAPRHPALSKQGGARDQAMEAESSTVSTVESSEDRLTKRQLAQVLEEIRAYAGRLLSVEEQIALGNLLDELRALGTPEAVEALVAAFRNEELSFTRHAGMFSKALKGIQDTRVFEAARDYLLSNVAEGQTSWVETLGYMELIAQTGGQEGGELLLDLYAGRTQARPLAVDILRHSPEIIPVTQLLEMIPNARASELEDVLPTLAASPDVRVESTIREYVFGANKKAIDPGLRCTVWEQFAQSNVGAPDAARFVRGYWRAQGVEESRVWLAGLRGVVAKGMITDELRDEAHAIVKDALGRPKYRSRALYVLDSTSELRTAEMRDCLELLLPTLKSKKERRKVERRLAEF